VSNVCNLARSGFRRKLGQAGRFYAPEVAICTNSCKKKVFEKRLDYGYTLPATTWLKCGLTPPATFVAQHVPNEVGACALQHERRYSGGVETSACKRLWGR